MFHLLSSDVPSSISLSEVKKVHRFFQFSRGKVERVTSTFVFHFLDISKSRNWDRLYREIGAFEEKNLLKKAAVQLISLRTFRLPRRR